MATWTVNDELDARLRDRVGGDVSAYVEQVITDHLAIEDDPAFRAESDEQIRRSVQELDSGEGVDARGAMKQIADDFGISRRG